MELMREVSRRRFLGGLATAFGLVGLRPGLSLWAQGRQQGAAPRSLQARVEEYDSFAKLANNENPWGPPDSVMKAMTQAFKYANRYGYPDGEIVQVIADHHGVKRENVMLGAGSGEILDVVGSTFLDTDKKVVGVEPTYSSVYQFATGIKADAIRVPLRADYSQDIPAMIKATRTHYREAGFVYLCNPNNPTGRIIPKQEVKQVLDGIPEDVPVLIDEAYHHFVDSPDYATAIPYVLEGRPVIVARTFSKIAALAGMRLGYAVAPAELIQRMRPRSTGTVNALVKWGGAAALKDTESQAKVKQMTLELRRSAVAELTGMGYDVIPSEANFFMVHIRREVQPVIQEFRKKGVLVGRPFPPMLQHLRVSVGTADEMRRFSKAFKEIVTTAQATAGAKSG
ncbi:MAG: aminotransferase class I/II-fold pyridoxal phosphate-dependent enzyme [Gemmatimonadetes bacterium]|nr:aminotransferase class I/II-fold pyridoxal phosphate-dependent enzyme [Gemmatimonadota bacterium]